MFQVLLENFSPTCNYVCKFFFFLIILKFFYLTVVWIFFDTQSNALLAKIIILGGELGWVPIKITSTRQGKLRRHIGLIIYIVISCVVYSITSLSQSNRLWCPSFDIKYPDDGSTKA